MRINSHKDLIVWQKAMDLVALVYRLTADFPKDELYGLTNQMRLSVVSVPSNIAEGWARKNTGEYLNSLSMADGSAAELDTQLILSERLNYGSDGIRVRCNKLLEEVQKIIPSLMKSLGRASS